MLETFDIRNFSDQLILDGGSQSATEFSYQCPICGADNFKVCQKTGKYQTFGCDCASTTEGKKAIRDKVAPLLWEKPDRPKQTRTWDYCDHAGSPIIRVNRTDSGDGKRRFLQKSLVKDKQPKDFIPQAMPYNLEAAKAAQERGERVFWVEGEGVVDAASTVGLVAVTTIGGSNGYKSEQYRGLLDPELLAICPDRDKSGLKYADQVALDYPSAQWLYALPNSPLWQRLPKDRGLDLADWIEELKRQGLESEQIKSTILAAVEDKRNFESPSPGENPKKATKRQKNSEQDEDQAWNQRAESELYSDTAYICLEKTLYRFTGTYYEACNDAVELAKIRRLANDSPENSTPHKVTTALEWVKLGCGIDPATVNPQGYLNCKNGILKLSWQGRQLITELLPHDPSLIFLDAPTVTYDPGADPTHLDKLLECLDPTLREILLRTVAASLDLEAIRKFHCRLPRAVLLYGFGSNGKDALRGLIFRLYGGKGCSSVSLTDFLSYDHGRKFGLADLEGSLVNWPSETVAAASLDTCNSLKAVITGDPISFERKGIQERRGIPQCVLLFNTNDPPKLVAATEAIKSRWAIIPFVKTFKSNPDPTKGELKADPRFKDDPAFIDEHLLPAFLNRLLAELQNLALNGINYEGVEDELEALRRKSCHLWDFCEEVGLEADPKGRVEVQALYALLLAWYERQGYLEYQEKYDRSGNLTKRQIIWLDEGEKKDRPIKRVRDVVSRFKELFPYAMRGRLSGEAKGTEKTVISGLAIKPSSESKNPETAISPDLGSLGSTSDTETQLQQGLEVVDPTQKLGSTQGLPGGGLGSTNGYHGSKSATNRAKPDQSALPLMEDPKTGAVDPKQTLKNSRVCPIKTSQDNDSSDAVDPKDPKTDATALEISETDLSWEGIE